MPFHLAQLALPTGDEPSPTMAAIEAISAEVSLASLGIDLADPADSLLARYASQATSRKYYVVALETAATTTEVGELGLPLLPSTGPDAPADVIGYLWLGLPLVDNQHLMDVTIEVASRHRRRGIGSALWQVAERVAGEQGRPTITVWSEHPPAKPGDPVLRPMTDVGEIPHDAAATFLLRRGFRLEQAERHSYLTLPRPADLLASLHAGIPDDPAYRVVQWVGATPAEYVSRMGKLREAMSTDVPSAGLNVEPEVWDDARVTEWDAVNARSQRRFTTAIEHTPTGDLVAYTEIGQITTKPAHAYQDATLVVRAHRGHRLGMLSKLANLDLASREAPELTAIHTWNAGENDHMLAINRALGFTEGGWEGGWELTLDSPETQG